MFCSNCGKQIAENDKFCCGCGAPVETVAPDGPAPVSEPDICTPEIPAEEPVCECIPEALAEEPVCEPECEAPAAEAEATHDTSSYPAYDFGMGTPAESAPVESEPIQSVPSEPVCEPAPVYPEYVPAEQPVYGEQPVYEQPVQYAPTPVKEKNGLRVLLGALLIIFAAVPYVLPYFVRFNTTTVITALMYSQDHYSIVSAFESLLSMAEPLFYFTASMTSLAAGCALIMKHRGSARLLKASIVINIIAIAFGVVSAGVLYFLPDLLVRVLGGGSSYAELAKLIMEELPQVLLYLLGSAVFHVAACIAAVIISVLIKGAAKSAWEHTELYKADRACAIVVIPYVMAVAKLAALIVERYVLLSEDSLYISVSSLAQSLLSANFSIYILAFAVLAVALAVLGRRVGAFAISLLWTVLAAAGTAVVITGAQDAVTVYMNYYGIGMEYYSLISNAFMAYAGVTAIWLIGFGIWMIASARSAFPVWLQVLLGVVVLAVYAALEFVRPMTGLAFYIQIGSLGALIVMIVASCVGVSIAKRREAAAFENTAPYYEEAVIEEAGSGEESPF